MSLNSKITKLEKLVSRNKRKLKKASEDHDKAYSIIHAANKSQKSKTISDDIKLYFALARGEKLHLAPKIKDLS